VGDPFVELHRFADTVSPEQLASWLSPSALRAAALASTPLLVALLEGLRGDGPIAPAITAAFPEVAALGAVGPAQVEHDAGTDRPLLDHVATRLLGRKLRGLEENDIARFQDGFAGGTHALSPEAFARLADLLERVRAAGLLPALRVAIVHIDVAKTSSAAHRGEWLAKNITLDVHNEASAQILRANDRVRTWPLSESHAQLAVALIEAHGLAGQHIRGEGPIGMYAPFVSTLQNLAGRLATDIVAYERKATEAGNTRDDAAALATSRQTPPLPMRAFEPASSRATPSEAARAADDAARVDPILARGAAADAARAAATDAARAIEIALDALHILDACDTSAVREGLLTDALLDKLAHVRGQLGIVCSSPDPLRALAAAAPSPDRTWLAHRLRALRAGRQAAGEPPGAVDAAVNAIGDQDLAALLPALATCQLWYCEAATSSLSPSAQLGVLAAAVGAARAIGVDVSRMWHAMLRPLVARLRGDSSAVRYRLRLVEAAIASTPMRSLLAGGASVGPLGTLSARLGHPTDLDTIVVDYQDTDESAALVTLLGTYETRSQVAYHTMLKALCDLYGLRKDEFDRVANEANYLATMNAAKSDKQRMLDFVKPGTIVEIGPGGGVVLDLLEERFGDSEIIGVDLSTEVVAALESRAKSTHAKWRVVLGAAEDLASHVPAADTVVFCSILHEVYSYTEPKFQLASVEAVVKAAYAVLRTGGRIVIRDGVMPPPGVRRIEMLAPDVRPTLELFCAQFEGRRITYAELSPARIEMSAADAMEFLYTYTWGPASFPYEVRELYGILPYDEYVKTVLAWCGPTAHVVENPLESYLQSGYRDNLAGKIRLTDENDQPVDLPESNCLIVIERAE
jgi:SAM-dependent methyltransferase